MLQGVHPKIVSERLEHSNIGITLDNPGPGGWGASIQLDGNYLERKGGEPNTTNNRMELLAAIKALQFIQKPTHAIELHTDSQYVQKGITEWIQNWKRNGWKTANKKPVKNVDLWKELDELVHFQNVDWKWVKGWRRDRDSNPGYA